MKNQKTALALAVLAILGGCGGGDGEGPVPSSSSVAGDVVTNTPASNTPASEVGGDAVIRVLSNRPDLISAGDALIEIEIAEPESQAGAQLYLNGARVHPDLVAVADREGVSRALIDGLALGENELRLVLPGHGVVTKTIINHPAGGPVFSGPQVQPWTCTNAAAIDAQCNQAPDYEIKYVPASVFDQYMANFDPQSPGIPDAFVAYDPANPPAEEDIATVTTDEGVTVPFIVRVERGVLNRDRYQIMSLYQPDTSWDGTRPQEQWNGKVLVHHGGNVGVSFAMGNPPNGDIAGTAPDGFEVLLGDSISVALSKGFVTLSTAQANLGHNVNLVTAAESLVMAKERIVEQYGPIRYTIGTGCSGGSIAQQHIANAYPGIYQGLIVQCSYPDVWTTATQFADYNLLNNYFGAQVPESPEDLTSFLEKLLTSEYLALQWPALYGHLPINPIASDLAFFPSAFPDQKLPGAEW
ncbi:DUF6351 family protein [Marinobacter salinexigens]|uniref:DUF6351 family protein n=1 Tax=Marinobacter salinexigens TaxID=2919747 RepID=UPI001CB72FCC|nr:DUF6351 family protein [Marinobacter salinexigens]